MATIFHMRTLLTLTNRIPPFSSAYEQFQIRPFRRLWCRAAFLAQIPSRPFRFPARVRLYTPSVSCTTRSVRSRRFRVRFAFTMCDSRRRRRLISTPHADTGTQGLQNETIAPLHQGAHGRCVFPAIREENISTCSGHFMGRNQERPAADQHRKVRLSKSTRIRS